MDTLKKIFPFSFTQKDSIAALIINILIHLVVGVVVGFIIGLIGKLPLVGLIVALVGGLADLYITAGIVMSILNYCKVIK